MTVSLRFEGLDELNRDLQKRVADAKGEMSEKFVTLALQGVSAQAMPFIPVDTSTLINSEIRQTRATPAGWSGVIGYGDDASAGDALGTPVSEYSVYVHEGPQKNWQKPGASNKFLEKGFEAFLREDVDRLLAFAFGGISK